jgi:hypothetical protein
MTSFNFCVMDTYNSKDWIRPIIYFSQVRTTFRKFALVFWYALAYLQP